MKRFESVTTCNSTNPKAKGVPKTNPKAMASFACDKIATLNANRLSEPADVCSATLQPPLAPLIVAVGGKKHAFHQSSQCVLYQPAERFALINQFAGGGAIVCCRHFSLRLGGVRSVLSCNEPNGLTKSQSTKVHGVRPRARATHQAHARGRAGRWIVWASQLLWGRFGDRKRRKI